jgi:predicted nuclease with TOPRIM domain
MAAVRGCINRPWVSTATRAARMSDDYNAVREIAGWLAAIGVGAWVGIKRLMAIGAREDVRAEQARAEESLINGLRTELERLGRQNGRLAETLNDLQNKIAGLNSEVLCLRDENARQSREIVDLHSENGKLRDQVLALQHEISEMRRAASDL